MPFFECEFPRKIGFTSSGGGTTPSGGPGWSTIVNMGFSGFEQRNRNWAAVRNKYQLDLVATPYSVYQSVLDFFLAVGGRADAFRFLDKTDYQFFNVPMINTVTGLPGGDGSTKVFQLQKQYVSSAGPTQRTYLRTISKPIMSVQTFGGTPILDFQGNQLKDTVAAYVNGTKKGIPGDFTVDATTGLVSFGVAPPNLATVNADGQFHIPVRFDVDDLPAQVVEGDTSLAGTQASNAAQLAASMYPLVTVVGCQLVEVRILSGQSQG